jgi:hypothetical protein
VTPPSAGQKHIVIVGATGMVGGYALRYALDNPSVGHVTSIGRKKLGISHPKLVEILHQDFTDCSALAEVLSGQDAAVFCLGTYTGAVSDEDLRKITVDYTVEFAGVLHHGSPSAEFSFLSGNGADPTGRSRMPLHAIRDRPRRYFWTWDSGEFIYSVLPISTRSSRARNRTSATACCAQFIPCFGYCSRTSSSPPTIWHEQWWMSSPRRPQTVRKA